MATHDYNIANADGATVRADINSVLEAVATNNSSSTAPSVTFPYMFWFDTSVTPGKLKQRNGANTAWIDFIDDSEVTTSTGTQALATAVDDRLVYVNTIAERDALTVAVGQQISVSGIIYENTGAGTWDNLSGFTTPEVHGAVGDGSADDTTAVTDADAEGVRLEGAAGSSYRLTSAITLSSPVFVSNGTSFVLDFSLASPSYAITLSGGVYADKIESSVPTTRAVDRALLVSGAGAEIDYIDISSVDQQNNRNANADAAIGVTASDISIGSATISNFDNGVHWSGDDGALSKLAISSYVRGVWLESPERLSFGTWNISTTSPNASGSPGHNGVLLDGVIDLTGEEINVSDSGEHGIRFSGSSNTDRIRIGRIVCRNTGNSGVKFRCNDAFTINDVNIDSIHCEDCGDATNPINNQEGLQLERVRRLWVGHYSVRKRNKSFSCHNAVSVFDAQIVTIDSVRIENTNREAFYLESEGSDDGGLTIYKDINDFRVGGGKVIIPGRHVIFLDIDTALMRNIHFDGPLHCRAIPDAALLAFSANSGVVNNTSLFRLQWDTAGTPANSAIRGSGMNSNVLLEVAGDNFDGPSAPAKPGSTWWNTLSGDRLIRNTAGSWVNII